MDSHDSNILLEPCYDPSKIPDFGWGGANIFDRIRTSNEPHAASKESRCVWCRAACLSLQGKHDGEHVSGMRSIRNASTSLMDMILVNVD